MINETPLIRLVHTKMCTVQYVANKQVRIFATTTQIMYVLDHNVALHVYRKYANKIRKKMNNIKNAQRFVTCLCG